MITLTTGQPGSGKTLFTLYQVNDLAKRENRPVFYSGIPELTLEWFQLDNSEEWWKCPPGAIIVIDECQRIFRPRGIGSQVPETVSRFETHRHHGHDVFLITQHPMLLDSNIRRLVGRHCHVMRAFGAKAANIHEWTEVKEQVDKTRSGSQQTLWKYPKEVFGWYKSAEVHTHKLRFPPRLFFLLLAPFLIAGLVYSVYQWWKPKIDGENQKELVSKATGKPVSGASPAASAAPKTREEYLDERIPRISGLLHTAPVYDSITQPTEAPIPVGCMKTATRCRCVDQQGSDYATDPGTCEHIVEHGMFVSWKAQKQEQPKADAEQPSARPLREIPPVDQNATFIMGPSAQIRKG